KVLLNNPSIHFSSHAHGPVILLRFNNGSATTLSGKEIEISGLTEANMLLREPTINSEGIINFANFYGYGQLYSVGPLKGDGLRINGKVKFDTIYSGDNRFIITNETSVLGRQE